MHKLLGNHTRVLKKFKNIKKFKFLPKKIYLFLKATVKDLKPLGEVFRHLGLKIQLFIK
jgi:hypothetical protein